MRVLITGGAGFIGTHLTVRLADAGHDILIVDNLHPQVHQTQAIPDLPARFVRGDVTDQAIMLDAVGGGGFDLIIHLAAETGTGQSLAEASRHSLVNVVGTTRLLDALTQVGKVPRHMLLLSSRAVYGEGRARPRTPPKPFVRRECDSRVN